MSNIKNIIASFNATLLNGKLSDVAEEVMENIIDNNLPDGIVKDIPIIGTLAGIIQTTQDISNYLFLRKIAAFVTKIKDVSPDDRKEVIQNIDNSGKYRDKVGISLLAIIDKCESIEKTEYIAIWFRAFLKKDIEYECFMYGTHIIQRAYIEDFKTFVCSGDTWKMIEDATDEISLGLYYLDITLNLNEYRREIIGASGNRELDEVGAAITEMGVTMRTIFQEAFDEGLID